MSHRPDLIVPVRDRRKRRRILTLKNFRKAILVIAIFFLGVTIQSDLRHGPADEYGRLFRKQVSGQVTVAPKNHPVVREAPIEDQTSADALLVSAAARGQYLVDPALSRIAPAGEPALRVVGDPNGITIVRGKTGPQHPTLSGGIFRQ